MTCLLCGQSIMRRYSLQELLFSKKFYADQICAHCRRKFQQIDQTTACLQCCRQLKVKEVCPDCQEYQRLKATPLKNRALFQYNSAMHDYFQAYKRHGDYRLRLLFAGSLREMLQNYQTDYTFVYIPTSPKHYQQRQFDPVLGLFADLCPLTALLQRNTIDWHQSELKRLERLRAPQIFKPDLKLNQQQLKSKILLLDDIYTTGTTLRRGVAALRSGGYLGEIESLTLAR